MKIIITAAIMLYSQYALPQDPLFTQFYNCPVSLNPAFTGTSKSAFRASFVYRRQWVDIPYGMTHIHGAVELNTPEYDWSMGLEVNTSREAFLKTTQISAILAKGLNGMQHDENGQEFYINAAAKGGIIWRNVDQDKLWLPEQVNEFGLIPGSSQSLNDIRFAKAIFLNLNGGIVATLKNIMVGVAVHRFSLLNGEKTLLAGSEKDGDRLPIRYTVHLSHIYPGELNADWRFFIKTTAIYQKQGQSQFITAGPLVNIRDKPYEFGIFYRISSFTKTTHGIAIGLNWTFGNGKNRHDPNEKDSRMFRIGTSYDVETTGPKTGGSIESGFLFEAPVGEYWYCKPVPPSKKTYPWMYQ